MGIRRTWLPVNTLLSCIFLESLIGKFSPKIGIQILELLSWLTFYTANQFRKFIKSLSFGSYKFSIASSNCTISDAKIKSIASLDCRITAAKIAMQIFKVLFGLRYMFIRQFSLLSTFHSVRTDLSGNRSFYLNFISYLRQSKNILISQMTHWRISSLNRYGSNCFDDPLINITILKIAYCTKNILIINNISHSKKASMIVFMEYKAVREILLFLF